MVGLELRRIVQMDRASNFDHLEELDAGLAAFGRFAERYFVDDANTALIKTRQFAERLAVLIAENAGLAIEQDRVRGCPPRAPGRWSRAARGARRSPQAATVRERGGARCAGRAARRVRGDQALPSARRLVARHSPGNPKLTIAFIPPRAARDEYSRAERPGRGAAGAPRRDRDGRRAPSAGGEGGLGRPADRRGTGRRSPRRSARSTRRWRWRRSSARPRRRPPRAQQIAVRDRGRARPPATSTSTRPTRGC